MPDFSRSDAIYYASPYKIDRTVPNRRKYALTEEEQAFLDEEALGLFADLNEDSSDESDDSNEADAEICSWPPWHDACMLQQAN